MGAILEADTSFKQFRGQQPTEPDREGTGLEPGAHQQSGTFISRPALSVLTHQRESLQRSPSRDCPLGSDSRKTPADQTGMLWPICTSSLLYLASLIASGSTPVGSDTLLRNLFYYGKMLPEPVANGVTCCSQDLRPDVSWLCRKLNSPGLTLNSAQFCWYMHWAVGLAPSSDVFYGM